VREIAAQSVGTVQPGDIHRELLALGAREMPVQ